MVLVAVLEVVMAQVYVLKIDLNYCQINIAWYNCRCQKQLLSEIEASCLIIQCGPQVAIGCYKYLIGQSKCL